MPRHIFGPHRPLIELNQVHSDRQIPALFVDMLMHRVTAQTDNVACDTNLDDVMTPIMPHNALSSINIKPNQLPVFLQCSINVAVFARLAVFSVICNIWFVFWL